MNRIFFLLISLSLNNITYGQNISQLGSWSNNANFPIRYFQDKVITSTLQGIQFIDVSNPATPAPTASIGNPAFFPMAIEIDDDYAYFGGGMIGYFMIADISNINFPFQVGITMDVSGTGYQIAISGNYAYMATNTDTLYTIDISNKTAPLVISKIDIGGFPGGIAIRNNYLYVGTSMGLKVVDVSTPTSPIIVNSFGSGYSKIAADLPNQRLFVAKASGFDAISISNPTNPIGLFMGIGGGSGGDICYWNNYVFQNGTGNVNAFEVTAINANYLCSFNSTFNGQINGITVKDSVFYVSTVNDLHVLKLGYGSTTGIEQQEPNEFKMYPNPTLDLLTIEFNQPFESSEVSITDISGRVIRNIVCSDRIAKIEMSNEKPGPYFVVVENESGTVRKFFIF